MAKFAPAAVPQETLKDEIVSIYSRVAEEPGGDFHFNRGARYAAETLGYDAEELALLPTGSTNSFAGVGNPFVGEPIEEGATVLDIGCGAGMDVLIAARRVGPRGKAIGVDFTESMRRRAMKSAAALGLKNVEIVSGDALSLPVEDETIDVVISNGVLNLTPNKLRAFREIVRVLKPGGRLQIADIVLAEDLSERTLSDIDLWTG
jgi:SAM-dependent methyltransferase